MAKESGRPDLGSVTYQKGPQPGYIIVGVVMVIASLVAASFAISSRQPLLYVIVGFSGTVIFLLGVLVFWNGLLKLQLYERGVSLGRKTLSFDEIESFVATVKRNGAPGIAASFDTMMQFLPYASAKKRSFSFSWTFVNADAATVLAFQDSLTDVVVERFAEQIATSGKATWIKDLAFQSEGLQCKLNGLPVVVPYENLRGTTEGTALQWKFILSDAANNRVIAKIPMNARNLVPGRKFLRTVCKDLYQAAPGEPVNTLRLS